MGHKKKKHKRLSPKEIWELIISTILALSGLILAIAEFLKQLK